MKDILMKTKFSRRVWFFATTSSLALLVACGGGGGSGNAEGQSFAASFNAALAAIAANPSNFTPFVSLLDGDYKQDGLTRTNLSAMLAADAAALPNEASFPNASLSNPTLSNCNSSAICDLTVTVTNNDADTVSTSITLKVKLTVAGYKLIGDGSAS